MLLSALQVEGGMHLPSMSGDATTLDSVNFCLTIYEHLEARKPHSHTVLSTQLWVFEGLLPGHHLLGLPRRDSGLRGHMDTSLCPCPLRGRHESQRPQ